MNAIQQIIGWMPALLQATGVTLALSVTSVLTALVLAVFLALGKISKNTVLRSVCGAYIFFFRGTPLLMQLFFLYYTLSAARSGVQYSEPLFGRLDRVLAEHRGLPRGDHPRSYSVHR